MNSLDKYDQIMDDFMLAPSKEKAVILAKKASSDRNWLAFLVNASYQNNGKKARHSVWIIDKLNNTHKSLIYPHLEKMINFLPECQNHTQAGIILRTIMNSKLDENIENLGQLFDYCCKILQSDGVPNYHRVYSIFINTKICTLYPEIKPEFHQILRIAQSFQQSKYILKLINETLKS